MRRHLLSIYYIGAAATGALLTACPAADYMPVYFPSSADEAADSVTAPPTPIGGAAACTIKFSSSLCVIIKRPGWSVGAEGQEPLCVEVPPIPIRIQGGKASLHGDAFPDLVVSGHGLPVPITINGKGATDGADNVAEGAVDASGNMTLQHFSFFINTVGAVGKIPDVTLTTGTAEGSKDLPDIKGTPASGSNLTLVGSKVLGSILPAVDKYTLGATLQVTFKGTIAPQLAECSGAGSALPTTIHVTKITMDAQKHLHEQAIPNGTQMEVAGNILIPTTDTDVGPPFEGSSRFRIRNISKQALPMQIPPVIGAFRIKPLTGDLTATLPSQQAIVVQVTFRPALKSKARRVQESLSLGSDFFTLIGIAREQQGIPSVHLLDDSGKTSTAATDMVRFPEVPVAAFTRQAYFQCETRVCDKSPSPTRCQACVGVTDGKCQLLAIDHENLPIGEVDAQCRLLREKAKESPGINLQGGTVGSASQTIVIRNTGTQALTITQLTIAEIAKSHSVAQFQAHPKTALPVTLAPYSNQTLEVVLTYTPTDLLGADDGQSGNTALDQALVMVGTQSAGKSETLRIKLRGITTVQDVPPLEIYFKSATGFKIQGDGSEFPIKGITSTTQNAAVPVQVMLAKSAGQTLRITNIELAGQDSDNFAWLDSPDALNALPDNERCDTTQKPVPVRPNGLDIAPQEFTRETMPLLGCINFHRNPGASAQKQKFETHMIVTTVALDAKKQPMKESRIRIRVLAVVNPRKGPHVFRIVQTMSILMIKENPTVAAIASKDEIDALIETGRARESDRFVTMAAMILDPFDEMTIKNEDGSVASVPGDGTTAIFRAIDTRPTTLAGDGQLSPFTTLVANNSAPEGSRGFFFDPEYNAPPNLQVSGLRVFTTALSWPGPMEKNPDKIPYLLSDCEQVDPCKHASMLGTGPSDISKYRGVCAFFYASAGGWDSPGMHRPSAEWPNGSRDTLCKNKEQPQKLNPLRGQYFPDGRLIFANNALRFWGPTYVHNPAGPVTQKPAALDDVFHITFSTDVLVPKSEGGAHDYVPEERINYAKQEYKVNLTDDSHGDIVICPNSTQNKWIGDKIYSSWKYFAPLLVQDKEGKVPAGCPEDGNSFPKTSSRAYLRGRPIDPVTGAVSVAAVTKFSSEDDMTFIFQDRLIYIVLNGWMCDPNGSEAEGEGQKCFDKAYSERDARSGISIMKEGK